LASISVNNGNHVRSVVSSDVTTPPGAVMLTAHSPRLPLIVKAKVIVSISASPRMSILQTNRSCVVLTH
jgi:hypothetical protein